MPLDVATAILQRRATKVFDATHEMPEHDLAALLDLTRRMPTAFNIQNWRFVVVRDADLRREIRAVAWDQPQVTDASALLILCADIKAWEKSPGRYWQDAPETARTTMVGMIDQYYRGREQVQRDEGLRSCGMAAGAIMLLAESMGYATCPMDGFDFDAVGRLIRLPADHEIVMFVAVGKSAAPPKPCGGIMPREALMIDDRFPG
ncbi:NADH/NADPH-flavin oxidoreductase [Ameyamaea chiangmaiensis NBRC 103196]|uniref:Nitroreductase family protein n=1 Tax=Ameyamaea chiangmaiensis TaxID=442969 RepID=A0A850PH96_9PROT|nr:nitroreductase family protein [Ameyamaea chiangmaiensis]MBS4074720.1 nitroreductase family protein [Ameyamaea chiangmaiensis]NVN41790.1 nitroreductase family protein [Ameyamaea chiangmaiensis]GBQ62487.1 NADH/NADPH-flavin oxidoreductase [Ameyamaea chiangmaiensis NBRC 103196]